MNNLWLIILILGILIITFIVLQNETPRMVNVSETVTSSDNGNNEINTGELEMNAVEMNAVEMNETETNEIEVDETEMNERPKPTNERAFRRFNLQTDTGIHAIDLDQVLSGGPGKDGIPALTNPAFTTLRDTDVHDNTRGILVTLHGEKRFYPYSILVWHEIVNDRINDTAFAVTFCPLCDSGIVFDRTVNGTVLQFGVSGLLFESNLLMYDTETESLWSQARSDAVVGAYTGTELAILPLQVITLAEVREKHPDATILSTNTGHRRNYNRTPYSGYAESETLYFPTSVSDKRFHAKEPFYIVPFNDSSLAFAYRQIPQGSTTFSVLDQTITVTRDGDEVVVQHGDRMLPAYFEFWFSWATHHQDDGIVLLGE